MYQHLTNSVLVVAFPVYNVLFFSIWSARVLINVSELINGINPFTLNDIVVIHKLLDIGLEDLVPTTLTVQMLNKVVEGVSKLDNAKLKIRMKDLATSG